MRPAYHELYRVFGRIGLLSFGGPAAQIALMHRELVEKRGWLDDAAFLRALSFCMLLPGPEAMQLATYAGWRLRGTPGGLIAGGLFVLPGACLIGLLAAVYVRFGQVPLVDAMFLGVQAAVLVIVALALRGLAGRALRRPDHWALALAAFVAIFVLALPFPLILAAAAAWGAWRPGAREPGATTPPEAPVGLAQTLRTILTWAAIWLLPLAATALWAPGFLAALGVFFAKLAMVTFGGAYAVLAYMTQEIVQVRGWLTTDQMIDALGLAETTPGPLILVTQFVAYVAGHGAGGAGLALIAALLSLWMTFAPCFLWIFAGAPYVERLTTLPRLTGALEAITAAVVGVMANLSLWFALHVLFNRVEPGRFGPRPDLASVDPTAVGLALFAAGLIAPGRLPLALSLAVMGAVSAAVSLL